MKKVNVVDDMENLPEPQSLRALRVLVTVLTVVMIAGFLVFITAFVIRMRAPVPFDLPAEITLPDGTRPLAFTRGPDWIAITTDDAILIYAPGGSLRQRVELK